MSGWSGLAILVVLGSVPASAQAQDAFWKEELAGEVYDAVHLHYMKNGIRELPPQIRDGRSEIAECLADQGDICYGGDPEDPCYRLTRRCRPEAQIIGFLERLKEAALGDPDDPVAIAQAVYGHARLRRTATAVDLAMECASIEWWCDLLRGLAHQRRGMPTQAEEYFRAGLAGADPELACRLTGIGELLTRPDRRDYDDLDCSARKGFEARFWWLADPMFSMPGNDRWAEHVHRRLEMVLHEPILWVQSIGEHPLSHEAGVVRRGQFDSWSWTRAGRLERWTSFRAARYRFTPAGALADGLQALHYELDADRSDEGYTPMTYGPVAELPVQFARFRQSDSLVVAAAADLEGVPLGPSRTVLVASDGPDSWQVVLGPVSGRERPVFAAMLAAAPVVVSVEAMDDHRAAGRARRAFLPLPADGLVASDVLLLDASGAELPESREEALALMLGETTLAPVAEVSVYWEIYGAEEGEPIRIAVSLPGGEPGLLTRMLRRIGIRTEEGAAEVTWTEQATAPVHPMALSLDVSNLEEGDYELRIAMTAADGRAATTTRTFRLEG